MKKALYEITWKNGETGISYGHNVNEVWDDIVARFGYKGQDGSGMVVSIKRKTGARLKAHNKSRKAFAEKYGWSW